SLPDSPPDSGSEPYSPDVNLRHQVMTDLKSTIPGSLPTLSQSMFLGHNNRLPGMAPTKAPPAYIGEPSKLSHLHQGPGPVQHQRVGMQYPAGMTIGLNLPPMQISPPLVHSVMSSQMGSLSNISSASTKKRKYSESPNGTLNPAFMHSMLSIKQEPPGAQLSFMGECTGDEDDLPSYDIDANGAYIDSTYQVIKWQPYTQSQWVTLTDGDLKDLPCPQYRVDADKGFNYSVPDEAFVCQKKNHFQVTVHMRLHGNAKYIRTPEGVRKIEHFYLHFFGVKMESQNQTIKIEQSQSDRSKKSFHPVKVDLTPDQETKVTVGRLHFSETTSNNMRKKGKPNPDQRYFLLVVSLHAHSGDKDYMLVGSVSDRIIVRASNPGQFDSEVEVLWQKGQNESVYHIGKVGVNTDHPDEALTIHGNLRLTGHLTQPSDIRAKENLQEVNSKNQLENVSKLRIYKYSYKEEYAAQAGIPPDCLEDTGVIAQEIKEVIPDAVLETGDVVLSSGETIENFLVVNKDRIFMENVGAVKELCKLTDNLEVRINQLEKMNHKLGKLKRFDSLKSTTSTLSARSIATINTDYSSMAKRIGDSASNSSSKRINRSRDSQSSEDKDSNGSQLFKGSKLSLSSMFSQKMQNVCSNRLRCVLIIVLVIVMAFCLAALAWLYILERQKSDASPPIVANTPSPYHTSLGSSTLSRDSNISTSTTVYTLSPMTDTTTVITSTASTTKRATLAPLPTQSSYQLVVPPFPACNGGFCEKLCCPPPHEDDEHVVVIGGGSGGENPPYSVNENEFNDKGYNIQIGDEEESGNPNKIITGSPNVENISNLSPSVIIQDNNVNGRKRRGVDDAPRPVIQIAELNYKLDDTFCVPNNCLSNNYSYYVPLNSSFGFGQIKLEFATTTTSHMALCNRRFMWNCASADPTDNITGQELQQAKYNYNHIHPLFEVEIIVRHFV
ncbi:hypothetical protein Btru_076097, partial [Bulinus truncatus]